MENLQTSDTWKGRHKTGKQRHEQLIAVDSSQHLPETQQDTSAGSTVLGYTTTIKALVRTLRKWAFKKKNANTWDKMISASDWVYKDALKVARGILACCFSANPCYESLQKG